MLMYMNKCFYGFISLTILFTSGLSTNNLKNKTNLYSVKINRESHSTLTLKNKTHHSTLSNNTVRKSSPIAEYEKEVESQCKKYIMNFFNSTKEKWTENAIDSFGNFPDALLRGSEGPMLGNFDQCYNADFKTNGQLKKTYKGKYCLLSVGPNIGITNSPMSENNFAVHYGVCMPSICSSKELNNLKFQKQLTKDFTSNSMPILTDLAYILLRLNFNCEDENRSFTIESIIVLSIILVIIGLSVYGTIEDLLCSTSRYTGYLVLIPDDDSKYKPKSAVRFMTIHFSLLTNGRILFSTEVQKGQIHCLNGIRTLSMMWVILGHTFLYSKTRSKYLLDIIDYRNNVSSSLIMWSYYSVDTFFVLSGFLTTYLILKLPHKLNAKTVITIIIHRYSRITPILILWVLFSEYVSNYFGDGPLWKYQPDQHCSTFYWRQWLYFTNFKPNEDYCFKHLWYLSDDWQFFLISPIYIIFWKSKKKSWQNVGVGIALGLIILSWITTTYLSSAELIIMPQKVRITEILYNITRQVSSFVYVYVKPYVRIGPYIMGCLTGYVLYQLKNKKKFLKKGLVALAWVLTVMSTTFLIFGLFYVPYGKAFVLFYQTFSRSWWGGAICWIIFACATEHGGFVNKFLSWRFWIPLSRLTYTAYISHMTILQYYYRAERQATNLSFLILVIDFLGLFAVTIAISVLIFLFIEVPFAKLEKRFLVLKK